MITLSLSRKLPLILSRVLIVIILLATLILVSNNILEYRAIKNQISELENNYQNKLNRVEEIEFYLETDIDRNYKEIMARLLGYCYPDEVVYYID